MFVKFNLKLYGILQIDMIFYCISKYSENYNELKSVRSTSQSGNGD